MAFARVPLLCVSLFAIAPLLCALDENRIDITLYIHRVYSGPGANQAIVVNGTNSEFGMIAVVDWTIREGPDPRSKVIGQAQGMHLKTSQTENYWYTPTSWVFNDNSMFNGSTLQLLGFININGKREWSIVGGTGEFSMARGVAKYTLLPNTTWIYQVNVTAYYSSMDSTTVYGKNGSNSKISKPIAVN